MARVVAVARGLGLILRMISVTMPRDALGAHEQTGQVKAGHALHGPVAGFHDPAVAQDHGEPQHVIAGGAVLGSLDPARVGAHVAPQGAGLSRGRVGWEHVAVRLQGLGQVGVDHAGLHHGHPVVDADLQDLVHAAQVQHHPAAHRHRQPGQAGARAPGDDREALPVGQPHHGPHLLGAAGPQGGFGPVGVRGGIGRVAHHVDELISEVGLAHHGAELVLGFALHGRYSLCLVSPPALQASHRGASRIWRKRLKGR